MRFSSYGRNKFASVSLFENAPKISHFCLGSFSSQSTFFSILSSLPANIRPHLAPASSNFRKSKAKITKIFASKPRFSGFGAFFSTQKNASDLLQVCAGLHLDEISPEVKNFSKNSTIETQTETLNFVKCLQIFFLKIS